MWKVNPKIFVAFCVFMMALTGPAAEGELITVANDGRPSDFISIQPAINYASNGDEIEVAPGTYNEAINFNGKAIRLYSSDGPVITNIAATGLNSSVVTCNSGEDVGTILEGFTITGGNSYKGGGMYNAGTSPTVTNCIFIGNLGDYGGGMYNGYGSNPNVADCTFHYNTALVWGAGMFNNQSNPTVTNCEFLNNDASWDGGGMFNELSSPMVIDCNFINNIAAQSGGGMYSKNDSNSIVTNCTFTGNTADLFGGGMYNEASSNPTVTNCTFSGNVAGAVGQGGGMLNYTSSRPTVTNCILWGNIPEQIVDYDSPSSTTSVSFSDVQGGGWPGLGNIDANPLFVDAAGGDLRLISSASGCVDTGTNGAPGLPATDLAGNPRIVDGDWDGTATVDMGAYEFQSRLIHNITQDRWYESIQVSIDDAANGDQIEVGPGTYNEAINFKGKGIRLYSSGGPEVTTIDGSGAYHVVQCVSGEDASTILEGFTITGGNATGSFPDNGGGGMYNDGSSPTVTNCTFSGNSASHSGGGMFNYNSSSPTVTDCEFGGNSADYGGGMRNWDNSNPTLTNCTFTGNTAIQGGGMFNSVNSPTVINCTFTGNTAKQGGGMSNNGSSPTVTNCTFSGNSAIVGGGMYNEASSNPTVTNCTFSGNVAGAVGQGGGMCNYWYSSPTVTNCILWGNIPEQIVDYDSPSSTTSVSFSDVQGGWGGTGNIDVDPCFMDAKNPDPNLHNLRLKPDSPCIDAGDFTVLMAVPVYFDLDGKIRYVDIDTVDDTGYGPLEFLDMGAYEFQCSGIGGDVNCDGVVDFKDLAILCNNWLAGTEPEL